MRREGDPTGHHSYTHEEPVDAKLGYQVKCSWFQQLYFQHLYNFAAMLDGVKEGDKSLLDRMILFAYTDHWRAATALGAQLSLHHDRQCERAHEDRHALPDAGRYSRAGDLHDAAGDGSAGQQLGHGIQSCHQSRSAACWPDSFDSR